MKTKLPIKMLWFKMQLTRVQINQLLMIGVLLIGFGAGFTIASGLCL